mgnify:CR=1 FL=1
MVHYGGIYVVVFYPNVYESIDRIDTDFYGRYQAP